MLYKQTLLFWAGLLATSRAVPTPRAEEEGASTVLQPSVQAMSIDIGEIDGRMTGEGDSRPFSPEEASKPIQSYLQTTASNAVTDEVIKTINTEIFDPSMVSNAATLIT